MKLKCYVSEKFYLDSINLINYDFLLTFNLYSENYKKNNNYNNALLIMVKQIKLLINKQFEMFIIIIHFYCVYYITVKVRLIFLSRILFIFSSHNIFNGFRCCQLSNKIFKLHFQLKQNIF